MTWVTYKKTHQSLLKKGTLSLYKTGLLYISNKEIYISKVDTNEGFYDILFNLEDKNKVAIKFNSAGQYKSSNTGRTGYTVGSKKIFKEMGIDLSKRRYFKFNCEDGMIVIDLVNDEIHCD